MQYLEIYIHKYILTDRLVKIYITEDIFIQNDKGHLPMGMSNQCLKEQGLISIKELWVNIHYPATAR